MSSPESRIDLACDRFEAAWKAGQRPRIEAYLAESPEPERAKLFGQLLRVELELRRRGGEAPTAEEYHLRFPDYSEAISRLFREEPSPPPDGSRPQPPEAPYHGNGPAPKDDPGATISEDRPLSFSVLTTAGEIRPLLGPSEIAALQAEFAPGVLIQNRYVLERELGAGGMGQVFLGHDDRLGRRVAIKVILPPDRRRGGYDPAHEARLREAFFEEARLGANLTHPAIATVFDFGLQGNKPFTVFEYIPGETLRALLRRRGSLPLEEVRLIIGPLAQALDFAHSRQVVHRDLKPENIRATEQGQFKILDLGLAKEFCREVDWSFAGTPAYASPEQAAGLACDGRTDQYALALIAFEMLTGRKLFEGRDPMVLLEQHRSQTLVWTDGMTRDIPDAVRDALGRALRKDPNRRFATCQEFAVAIGCQLLNTPVPLPEVILETEVERITSSWLSQYISFGRNTRSVHLVLTRDALWSAYHGEIQQIPLRTVEQFRPLITARDLGTAVSTAVAITDAEAIRRVNGSGEAHNLTLGVLDYPALFALALALCGISLSAESVEATTPVSLGLLELINGMILLLVLGSTFFEIGPGLSRFRHGAQWLMVANLTALLLSAITIYLFILVIGPLIITFHWDWIMATKAFYWYVKFPFFLSSLISSLPLFAYGIFALYPRRISGVSARSRRIALNPANHLFRMLGWHDSKRGRLLQLKQRGTWVIFRFTTALECWYWAAHMANLITEHPTSPEESVGETEPGQIVLLRKRLNIRYQLLGTLEAKAEKRWVAEAGLQVRAAMIKADAVVDVQEERLTDFHRTVRRLTGTAVRAVDPEGRFEFRSRWFANRIAQVCSWTVSLLLVYLLFSFIEQFTR